MILVTGATGFLGSHLLMKLLDQNANARIRAMYRKQENLEKTKLFFDHFHKPQLFSQIVWIQSDILEIPTLANAFDGVDFVYHCAALVSFDPADEDNLRKTNIEGTANVVNFCLDFNIKKLLYVSSIAALGDLLPHETIISETTEWNPEIAHSDYAISKFGAEMEVWRAQQEGLDVLIINPGVIFGTVTHKEQWHTGSAQIFSTVAASNQFYTKGTTGFVCLSDVVSIMVQLMQSDIKNEKYVVVAENINYQQLTNSISKNLKKKPAKIYAQKWITHLAWRIDWIAANIFNQKRTLSKSLAKSLHANDVYDNSKIVQTLQYDFRPLDDCISEIAAAYLASH